MWDVTDTSSCAWSFRLVTESGNGDYKPLFVGWKIRQVFYRLLSESVVCYGLDIWRILGVVLSWRFTGQLEAGMFGFRVICLWNRAYPCFFPNQWYILFPCAVFYYFGYWASNYFSNHFQKFDRNLIRAGEGVVCYTAIFSVGGAFPWRL